MKRFFDKAAAVCIAAAVALGCGSCSFKEVTYNESTAEISFSWWGGDERNERTLEGLSKFQEQTGIMVDAEYSEFTGFKARMDSQFYSETQADVMQLNYDWLYQYSPEGDDFYDLGELTEYIDLGTYTEESLECGTINGKLNAVPYSMNVLSFVYNKKLYDSYGLPLPKTWEDLFEAAKVMSKDGVYPLCFSSKHLWMSCCVYLEQTTGKKAFYDDEPAMSAEDLEIMLEFGSRLLGEKVTCLGSDFDRSDFVTGSMAGVVTWISDLGYYADADNNGAVVPTLGDYVTAENSVAFGWEMKPTGLYAIKKTAKDPEAAAKLMDYLINSADMAALLELTKGVPISTSAVEALEARDLLDGMEYDATCKMNGTKGFGTMSYRLEAQTYIDIFTQALESIYYGKADVQTAAQTAYSEIHG